MDEILEYVRGNPGVTPRDVSNRVTERQEDITAMYVDQARVVRRLVRLLADGRLVMTQDGALSVKGG